MRITRFDSRLLKEWSAVYIDCDTHPMQPALGKAVDFEPEDVFRLSWRYTGQTGETGSVFIDNVRFVNTIPSGQGNN